MDDSSVVICNSEHVKYYIIFVQYFYAPPDLFFKFNWPFQDKKSNQWTKPQEIIIFLHY